MGLEQKWVCAWKLKEKKQIEGTFPFCGHSGPVVVQNTEALGHMRWGKGLGGAVLFFSPPEDSSVLFDLPKLTTGNNRIQEAS